MTTISDKFSSVWTFATDLPSNDPLSFVLLLVGSACLHEWALIHYLAGVMFVLPSWTDN